MDFFGSQLMGLHIDSDDWIILRNTTLTETVLIRSLPRASHHLESVGLARSLHVD